MTKEELETENKELKERISKLEFTNKVLVEIADTRLQKINGLEIESSTLKVKINGGK